LPLSNIVQRRNESSESIIAAPARNCFFLARRIAGQMQQCNPCLWLGRGKRVERMQLRELAKLTDCHGDVPVAVHYRPSIAQLRDKGRLFAHRHGNFMTR
jgi:hypothetical protein